MRNSKQREVIIKQIKNRYDHPTASVLFDEIKAKDANVSIATIYRNLNLLVANGELKKFSVSSEDHFDPNIDEHHHFICDQCGLITDIELDKEFVLYMQKIKEQNSIRISHHELIIHGICKKCKECK